MFRNDPLTANRLITLLALGAGLSGSLSSANAADTQVVFDLPTSSVCRDVTPEGFAQANPDRRVFEARLEISIRIAGDEHQIEEMTFEFASPERRWLVHDYYPRTMLETEYAAPICVTKSHENSRSLGASLGAGVPTPIGSITPVVSPGVNGQVGGKDVVTETTKRIAPKKAVLVSGTLGEGHGVFFEWKPSTQDTWAGSRVHIIRFIAPASWQGDWACLICRTKLAGHGLFRKSPEIREVTRSVGLHRLGDRQAAQAVERLSLAQSKYLRAVESQDEPGSRSSKSLFGHAKRNEAEAERRTAEDWHTQMVQAQRALAGLSGADAILSASRQP